MPALGPADALAFAEALVGCAIFASLAGPLIAALLWLERD